MPKKFFAFLCLLCVSAASFGQAVVTDSLGVDKPQANTPASLVKGRVSGVLVTATDGSPAGALNTYIRGLNALGDDSQPLWIVDGVMLNRSQSLNVDPFWNVPGRVYAPSFNDLAFLNPYDIESVEVLKDIAATALYGPRGANGVIIVTTGKASDKALDVRVNSNVSLSSAGKVNGTRNALGHNHSVRVSTNRNLASYYLSGFFRQENGVVNGSANRYGGLRVGFDASASSVFQTGLNCAVAVGRQGSPAGVNEPGQPSRTLTMRYPLEGNTLEGWDEDYVDYANEYRLVNSAYLNINFTDHLALKADLGVDYQNTSRYFWLGNGTPFGLEQNGANAILTGSTFAYNANIGLNYAIANDVVDFKVKGGMELLGSREKLTNMNGMDIFSHFLREKSINIIASKPESHRIDEKYFHWGVYLNPTLVLEDVVGMDVIVRADKTPRFDRGKDVVLYPGATLFLNLHEIFFPGSDIVDKFKVSAGYGASGVERTVPWIAIPNFSLTPAYPAVESSEDFYEALLRSRSSETNLRLELAFVDQVRIGMGYYNKSTKEKMDLYFFGEPMTLTPNYYQVADPQRHAILNDYSIKNAGYEFDFSADAIKTDNFLWNVNANAAFNDHSNSMYVNPALSRLLPTYSGGVGTTVTAGGFTFDALGTFVGGNQILNLNIAAKDGVPADLEPLYEKGDYFRLARVSVSYDFLIPAKWIRDVRVTLSGNNLLTASKYTGWNPDVNCYGRQGAKFGVDYGSFPAARTFLLGVNVNF